MGGPPMAWIKVSRWLDNRVFPLLADDFCVGQPLLGSCSALGRRTVVIATVSFLPQRVPTRHDQQLFGGDHQQPKREVCRHLDDAAVCNHVYGILNE